MAWLEDFVRPSHDVRNCRAEAETNDKEAAVSGPGVVVAGKSGDYEASNLDKDGYGKDKRAMSMEAVRDRHHDENGDEIALQINDISVCQIWPQRNRRDLQSILGRIEDSRRSR